MGAGAPRGDGHGHPGRDHRHRRSSAEYLRDGENSLVVGREADPRELAAAVRDLAADPALRGRLRENGLATAARFTEEAYNEAIERALQSAVI